MDKHETAMLQKPDFFAAVPLMEYFIHIQVFRNNESRRE